jgi:Pyruvate-formate lyase-activating enzyme
MKTIDLEKWSRLALYQEKLPNQVVHCHVCPHNCLISNGKYGLCKTRVNKDGQLYSIAYGNPCSVSIDPVEKKPLFHFYPGARIYSLATAGCNFRCLNCQNWEISQSSPLELQHLDLSPVDVVQQAIDYGFDLIAFTYTEPTVFYEYILDTAKIARQKGLKTVLISNGYINPEPLLNLCEYIDAANIDLKCFDDSIYRKLTGGRLQPVLDTLKTIIETGVWLEITNLIIPDYSDKQQMIETMCNWLVINGFTDTPLHFSRFFPTYKMRHLQPTDQQILLRAKEIAEVSGLKYVYIGNQPELDGENTFCPQCKHVLMERVGYRVNKNLIHKGQCTFCGESIAGVWK